jgi:hypothetical protein
MREQWTGIGGGGNCGEDQHAAAQPCRPPGGADSGGNHDAPHEHPAGHIPDVDACIRDLVAAAPPLTPAQRDRLALLFSGTYCAGRQVSQGGRRPTP